MQNETSKQMWWLSKSYEMSNRSKLTTNQIKNNAIFIFCSAERKRVSSIAYRIVQIKSYFNPFKGVFFFFERKLSETSVNRKESIEFGILSNLFLFIHLSEALD